MNDCSSIQGSTTSSSSDVTTLTTASSWCSIPASSRLRVIRLIRPHSRRFLVSPSTNPSFGFALRGGKEFGSGFFVSSVERYNEADQKGLKVGDQILRVNGYRVDDAVHKELIQFISCQDRLTLKVRGVGLIPIKNKENDTLTWHAVKTNTTSTRSASICTEDSFRSLLNHHQQRNSTNNNHACSKDVHIVLNVAPRTKLGLGICKGPEWKPGIFIQFTKEKSVAREAGLRPGDQILCVNSIDFSDVLFREAVAVMKNATKLDMIVRTAAGSDLFPGESSGYNSSASSVTGDQSPCWADVSAKRLTVVREEPHNDYVSVDYQKIKRKPNCGNEKQQQQQQQQFKMELEHYNEGTLREMNKTIIKLSENGTSINNTYIEDATKTIIAANEDHTKHHKIVEQNDNYLQAIPPPPPTFAKSSEQLNLLSDNSDVTEKVGDICFVTRQSEAKTVIVEVHRNNSINKIPQQQLKYVPLELKDQQNEKMNATERKFGHTNEESNGGDNNNSTLCSAIAQELKKRKEKLHSTGYQKKLFDDQENRSHINNSNSNSNSENPTTATSLAIKSNKKIYSTTKNNRNASGGGSGNGGDHNGDDQHNALMNEFKRAHQRMFKNGFQENDRKERQDALKHTTVKDYREEQQNDSNTLTTNIRKLQPIYSNGIDDGGHINLKSPPPPPPPLEFMGVKPLGQQSEKSIESNTNKKSQTSNNDTTTTNIEIRRQAPISPVPDYEYEQVQIRGTIPKTIQAKHKSNTDRQSIQNTSTTQLTNTTSTTSSNRRTMRLGTVTIGEYATSTNVQNHYREPVKFDFLTTKKINNDTDNQQQQQHQQQSSTMLLHSELQNTLSRSNLKKRTTSNASEQQQFEHQSHCHLVVSAGNGGGGGDVKKNSIIDSVVGITENHNKEHEYTNVEKLRRMLQLKPNMNDNATLPMRPMSYQNSSSPRKKIDSNVSSMRNEYSTGISTGTGPGNGILKNGNGNKSNRNSLTKTTEKSISFGN